jgi:hypothetical protein
LFFLSLEEREAEPELELVRVLELIWTPEWKQGPAAMERPPAAISTPVFALSGTNTQPKSATPELRFAHGGLQIA